MSSESEPQPSPKPPSHPFVTADNHTSLLNIMGWFLALVIILVVLTRLGTRWAKSRTVGFDDGAIILSTVLAMAQTITVSMGVKNGLGRLSGDETESQLNAQQKAIYAFTILFVLGQFFAKLSVTGFVIAITPNRRHKRLAWGVTGANCIWMLSSVFGFAFQCDLPETWKFIHHKCINRVAFYTFVEVFNIVLDTALALLPSFIILSLQIDSKRKMITVAFFMSRLFVVAASITQLVVIYSRTEDPFISWTYAFLVMIIQTFGIVTACGPYLKPFLDSINSGMIGNDDIRRRQGGTTQDYYGSKSSKGSKEVKSFKKSGGFFGGSRNPSSKASQQDEESELRPVGQPKVSGTGQAFHKTQVTTSPNGKREEWEVESQSSRARIILQTTSYRVSSETSE